MQGALRGRGVRLSVEDVRALARDDAIAQVAAADNERQRAIWPKLVGDSVANQIALRLRAGARLMDAAEGYQRVAPAQLTD